MGALDRDGRRVDADAHPVGAPVPDPIPARIPVDRERRARLVADLTARGFSIREVSRATGWGRHVVERLLLEGGRIVSDDEQPTEEFYELRSEAADLGFALVKHAGEYLLVAFGDDVPVRARHDPVALAQEAGVPLAVAEAAILQVDRGYTAYGSLAEIRAEIGAGVSPSP
jgi:hypothetical protein